MTRVLARALLPLLALALLLPATASAGATKRDKGGVNNRVAKRLDLTRVERRALDVVSAEVIGREGFGIFVDVRFRGNVSRALGRRHLKRAAVALILRPKSRRRKASVLVTRGPARNQRVLRRTRSRRVGAVRQRRVIRFFIAGSGFSGVRSVQVKALPRVVVPRRARGAGNGGDGLQLLSEDEAKYFQEVEGFLDEIEFKASELGGIDPKDCDDLLDLLADLTANLAELNNAEDELEEDIADAEDELDEIKGGLGAGGLSPEERSDLNRRREAIEDKLDELEATLELVETLIPYVEDLIDEVRLLLIEECGETEEFLDSVIAWVYEGAAGDEVAGTDWYFRVGRRAPTAADVRSPITAIRVVIPLGDSNRQITNFLCPSQLPQAGIASTNGPNDTLICSGGSLAIEERFRVNVRTSPPPNPGMGGQLFGEQDGAFKGPFTITGP